MRLQKREKHNDCKRCSAYNMICYGHVWLIIMKLFYKVQINTQLCTWKNNAYWYLSDTVIYNNNCLDWAFLLNAYVKCHIIPSKFSVIICQIMPSFVMKYSLPDQHQGDLRVLKIPHRTPCMSTTLDIPAEIKQQIANHVVCIYCNKKNTTGNYFKCTCLPVHIMS